MNLGKKVSAATAGVFLVAFGVFGVALPGANASSAVTGTTCTSASGSATVAGGDATPGVDLAPPAKTVTAKSTGSLSGCNNGVTGGTISIPKMTSSNLTCTSGSAKGTGTITWNTGAKSTGTLILKATTTPLQFTLSGTVATGLFKGSSGHGTFTATPVTGNCDTGVTPADLTKATITNNGPFTI